jgi:hypothetical protein
MTKNMGIIMNKKITITMLLTILVLSLSIGVVIAKKPSEPPGKPTSNIGEFKITIDGDVELLYTVEPNPDLGADYFWDYTGSVAGGDPRERYRWSYYDGGYGYPFICFGHFAMVNAFEKDDFDYRPVDETSGDAIHVGRVELMWITHRIDVDAGKDYWQLYLNWTRWMDEHDRYVGVSLLGLTSNDASPEGTAFDVNNDGHIDQWQVTFSSLPSGNADFLLDYWWPETFYEPLGNSGKYKEVYGSQRFRVWAYTDPQPALTITVTIDRLS